MVPGTRVRRFRKALTSALRAALADQPELTAVRHHLDGIHQQLQSLASLAQRVGEIEGRLVAADFHPSLRRKVLAETSAATQGVQLLLRHRYQELITSGRPLPELADTEFRLLSQNGEDGLLLYIFTILGTTTKRVVEIAAGDGIECNAANLIINHGWYGLLFDGDPGNVARGTDFYSRCQDTFAAPPTLVASWITRENIDSLIASQGFGGEIDLLSLDIDGIDYWVLQAIQCISPRVIILEFNPVWGPHRAVTVPYRPDFRIDYTRRPYYAGASLSAFAKLAGERGYRLIGIQRLGFNAVFVRSDVGEGLLPTISPARCFEQHSVLKTWGPHWIPDVLDWPEWKDTVDV